MSVDQNSVGRRTFVKSGLLVVGGLVATSGEAVAAGNDEEKVHMTWSADILPGGFDAFKEMAKEWEAIAAKDSNCLYSKWMIKEDKSAARLCTLFTDSSSARDQFPVNIWHILDKLRADKKIKYTGMIIDGKRTENFEWLKDFDIDWMVPAIT